MSNPIREWNDKHMQQAYQPTIGERLEDIDLNLIKAEQQLEAANIWLPQMLEVLVEIRDLMRRQSETDPFAILNDALKQERERDANNR